MSATPVRVVITGAAGRMGRMLVQAVVQRDDLVLAGAVERPESPSLGADAGTLAGLDALGVPVVDGLASVLADADVVVDFTAPAATLAHVAACREAGVAMVIGTTGLDAEGIAVLDAAAGEIPLVVAPNYGIGINVLLQLLRTTARTLGDDVDIEIVEAHHRHKVDAPSGTALRMGEVIAETLDRDLEAVAVHGREGQTGARTRPEIGFSVVRGGDIVGEHTAWFIADGERIEITHRATSRMTFAAGAARAAAWVAGRPAGRYDMPDVLGLETA